MTLTKEAKELIDKWFDNKTPEEVDYIISKYTPNKQSAIDGVRDCLHEDTFPINRFGDSQCITCGKVISHLDM